MIPLQQVLTTTKEQLNLTHSTSEDGYLGLKINESIGKMNDLIKLTVERCCVDIVSGYSAKPEGYVAMIYANVAGFPYIYANQSLFLYYGLTTSVCQTGSKSIVDCFGIVKETNNKLDWGAQTIDGTADIVYSKLNKVKGEYLIPDNCELSAAYYACAMYSARIKDWQGYGVYNNLYNANSGKANSEAVRHEFDQDKMNMRRLIYNMFSEQGGVRISL